MNGWFNNSNRTHNGFIKQDSNNSKIFALYEPFHVTSLNTYKPYLLATKFRPNKFSAQMKRQKKHDKLDINSNINCKNCTHDNGQQTNVSRRNDTLTVNNINIVNGNGSKNRPDDREKIVQAGVDIDINPLANLNKKIKLVDVNRFSKGNWYKLDIQQRLIYQTGIIYSILTCDLIDYFDDYIGMHHDGSCLQNGLETNCSLNLLQLKCQESNMIVLKTIWFDYRAFEIFVNNVDYHIPFLNVYFVILLRNPIYIIESSIDAVFYGRISKGMKEICVDYYNLTVLPLLDYCQKTTEYYNDYININNNSDQNSNIAKVMIAKYETMMYDLSDVLFNFVKFIGLQWMTNGISKEITHSEVNAFVELFEKEHTIQYCTDTDRELYHYSTVRCQNWDNNTDILKKQHFGHLRDRYDYNKSVQSGFAQCQPFMTRFNYSIPRALRVNHSIVS